MCSAVIRRKNTLKYNWSDKHIEYMRKTQHCDMNIAEGSIRSGKTTDNVFCFAHDIKRSKDKLHLATASTQPTAKIIIGDCDGYGLEHIFRGQCKWGKYKGNEALRICGKDTNYKEKIVLFCGGAKADSYKKFRGMSIGLWIATEINLHHAETIREAQRRQINADIKRFYWDLNPDSPNAEIYKEFIDQYEKKSKNGSLKGGFNLQQFNIFDNINLSEANRDSEISKYEIGSVYYKRDILGIRCAAEGIVFRDFAEHPEKYKVQRCCIPDRFVWCKMGYDIGGNGSAYGLTAVAQGYDGVVYAMRSNKYESREMRLEQVPDICMEFINNFEADYGVEITKCYVDDNYYSIVNSLNDRRFIFDAASKVKAYLPLYDRPRKLISLMAQGKFKIVDGECDPLEEEMRNAVFDPKEEKTIILDDGTQQIDCMDSMWYALADDWNFLGVVW